MKIVKPISQKCNIVLIESDYREFFKPINVKFRKTPYQLIESIKKYINLIKEDNNLD